MKEKIFKIIFILVFFVEPIIILLFNIDSIKNYSFNPSVLIFFGIISTIIFIILIKSKHITNVIIVELLIYIFICFITPAYEITTKLETTDMNLLTNKDIKVVTYREWENKNIFGFYIGSDSYITNSNINI